MSVIMGQQIFRFREAPGAMSAVTQLGVSLKDIRKALEIKPPLNSSAGPKAARPQTMFTRSMPRKPSLAGPAATTPSLTTT